MEQEILKNNTKTKIYAADDNDKSANGVLEGLLRLLKKDYLNRKISRKEYLLEKSDIEKALASK
jgi:hypothetical protein